MWRLRRRKTGKLIFQTRQCIFPFRSVHIVIHLMHGLSGTSLLFMSIHVASGVFLVLTLLDMCFTAVLQHGQVAFHTFIASHRQQKANHQP